MRFVDETTIFVQGGHGGRGCVSFRREKFVPNGGPDGGDGGHGGDVILCATSRASTLLDLQFTKHYRAKNGSNGSGSNKTGSRGKTIELQVPVGTVIYDAETGASIGDLVEDGQTLIVAKGGIGGLGNARFVNSTRQAPDFAQPGRPGEERRIRLELKLLADVGLVGFPNAGKSTLIRSMSRSRAKVADYPFTTLVPNLGVVPYDADRHFVIADVPGLIEGAADGAGLGHQFLRHIERTRVLVYMLDSTDDVIPPDAFKILHNELQCFENELVNRPYLVCLNKTDLVDSEWLDMCEESLRALGVDNLHRLSALTGDGTKKLITLVADLLEGRVREPWED